MTFDDVRNIILDIKSSCIYHGYNILYDGITLYPSCLTLNDNDISIEYGNVKHILIDESDVNDYTTAYEWVTRYLMYKINIVKRISIDDVITHKSIYN